MENINFINKYFDEMKQIIDDMPKDKINEVIESLFNAWKNGNKVFIMGNGGSASTATHFTCDLSKVTIVNEKKRFKIITKPNSVMRAIFARSWRISLLKIGKRSHRADFATHFY